MRQEAKLAIKKQIHQDKNAYLLSIMGPRKGYNHQ
jgi:hypothetical protein